MPLKSPPTYPTSEELLRSSVAVIREVYHSENFFVKFEMDLDDALDAETAVIIIEPERLAEITLRWIVIGNGIHIAAVCSGVISIVSGFVLESPVCVPFGVLSMLCTSCYTLSWQTDPCSNYQQELEKTKLARLQAVLTELTSTAPLVLVRKENKKRIMLHCSITLAATAVCLWKIYRCIN